MHAPFLLLYLWWSMLMAPFQTVRIPGPGGAAAGGGGSPALANSNYCQATTCVVGNVSAGNIIVYGGVLFAGGATLTVTDNCNSGGGSNTYSQTTTGTGGMTAFQGAAIVGATTSSCTLSFSASGGGPPPIAVQEWGGVSGIDGTNSQFNFQNNAGSGTDAYTSGTPITTSTADGIFGWTANDTGGTSVSAGTGFTLRGSNANGDGGESLVQSAAGSVQVTFTQSVGNGSYFTGIICLH